MTSADPIRAALERLVEAVEDYEPIWGGFPESALAEAQAALAEQQGEGPRDIPPAPFSEQELREQWNQQADEFNQWDSLDSCEQLAWAQARAIQRDRNARPTPPAEGDTKERVWPPSVAAGCHEAAVSAVTGSPEQQLLVTAGNTIENLWQELHRTVPARPTPPAQGEVAELVAWLHGQDGGLGRRAIYARIAKLLQQQQAEIQKLWTWLLACEGTANARAGGSGKPKWPAHALPLPQGEVQP